MARITLSYQNLYDEVSWMLGLTARGTSPTGTNLTTCKSIVDRGIRQFLYPLDEKGLPHQWEFLKFPFTFKTISNQWKYALPVDYSEMLTTFYYDNNSANPPLLKRNSQQIMNLRSDNSSTGYPEYFAITPSRYDLEIGTTYELWTYPTPDASYTLSGFYRADPVQLTATTDLVVGGIRASEAILESCLAVAETQEDDSTTKHHQAEARKLVLTLIKFDRGTETDKIGNLYINKDRKWPPSRSLFANPNMDNVYDGDSGADL